MIESLTEDELALVLTVVNAGSSLQITDKTLRAYRFKFLAGKLLQFKDRLTEAGKPIFISTLSKLKIPIPEDLTNLTIHDQTQETSNNAGLDNPVPKA